MECLCVAEWVIGMWDWVNRALRLLLQKRSLCLLQPVVAAELLLLLRFALSARQGERPYESRGVASDEDCQ